MLKHKSWKTTATGILQAIGGLLAFVPHTQIIGLALWAISTIANGYFAKDNDKSSEKVRAMKKV